MNDTTCATTPAPDGMPAAADRAPDLGSQVLAWVNDHPLAALAVAGVVGATLGAIVTSASGTRHVGQPSGGGQPEVQPSHGSPSHGDAAGAEAAPAAPDDNASIEPVLRALLGGAAALAVTALQRWTAADGTGEPDPMADLADTDQFAQAPEAPPDFASAR